MDIVIVESPAKASTINKYLGADYKVVASYGHIRDLPEKEGSVQPDKAFAMLWQSPDSAARHIQNIVKLAQNSQRIILATDPDREGEAISWHVLEVLKQKNLLADKDVCRVVFNAITREAVLDAMAHPRKLDMNLVDAYLARRALDYLVGFNLSPVLWRKLPGARSAGRVQSVALRLICERELEIRSFTPREYWSVQADLQSPQNKMLKTRLVEMDGKTLERFDLANAAAAQAACRKIEAATLHIDTIARKRIQRAPTPPFITSSLQQEASRKLGFSARQTMQLAQKLYEGIEINGETQGLITYMRTDSTQLAPEALAQLRTEIGKRYGDTYLPQQARQFRKKSASAQEAHEAIRPVNFARDAQSLKTLLSADMLKLYQLIWIRAMASQMANAQLERTTIDVRDDAKMLTLRATGTVVAFDGFLRLYEEGTDTTSKEEGETILPALEEKTPMQASDIHPNQHFTEPPPRYNEASLVKKMEELGIGRPSTYATILSVLRDREYVYMDSKRFMPHDKGLLVVAFLENFFRQYVEYDFTAELETSLDEVSTGQLAYRDLLKRFWQSFHPTVESTLKLRNTEVLNRMNEVLGAHIFGTTDDAQSPEAARKCKQCDTGELSLKTGRYGAFIGCTNYPECRFTRPFATNGESAPVERLLGHDPNTQQDIWLKTGRFGPYVQRGEAEKNAEPPKRASLPKGVEADTVELEYALQLLSLPRSVGVHPETGETILADIGRYGPYLRHGKQSASLEMVQEVFEIGLNRAVSVLEERKNRKTGARRGQTILHELGEHPETGKPVQILNGRFGPYVRHDGINASIPASTPPEEVDMELAITMLAARAARLKSGKGKVVRKKGRKAAKPVAAGAPKADANH